MHNDNPASMLDTGEYPGFCRLRECAGELFLPERMTAAFHENDVTVREFAYHIYSITGDLMQSAPDEIQGRVEKRYPSYLHAAYKNWQYPDDEYFEHALCSRLCISCISEWMHTCREEARKCLSYRLAGPRTSQILQKKSGDLIKAFDYDSLHARLASLPDHVRLPSLQGLLDEAGGFEEFLDYGYSPDDQLLFRLPPSVHDIAQKSSDDAERYSLLLRRSLAGIGSEVIEDIRLAISDHIWLANARLDVLDAYPEHFPMTDSL
jgi:hypothetical protein